MKKAVTLFEEAAEIKMIDIRIVIDSKLVLNVNSYLLEILFNNLISNAIKYNEEGGFVEIQVTEPNVSVANSGENPTLSGEEMFDRFTSSDSNRTGVGLGLAIVKQICDSYEWKIQFQHSGRISHVTIDF